MEGEVVIHPCSPGIEDALITISEAGFVNICGSYVTVVVSPVGPPSVVSRSAVKTC
jgi:hypothetical protein